MTENKKKRTAEVIHAGLIHLNPIRMMLGENWLFSGTDQQTPPSKETQVSSNASFMSMGVCIREEIPYFPHRRLPLGLKI